MPLQPSLLNLLSLGGEEGYKKNKFCSFPLLQRRGNSRVRSWSLWFLICILPFQYTSAFLWEDLGLDLYKQIDEWFYELERKQYEYELTGQWETSVQGVIWPILAEVWVECDINSIDEMENVLGNGVTDQVPFIVQRCAGESEKMSNEVIERIVGQMEDIKNNFRERALSKANTTFDVAKIWLYSDGNIENSPFDLIHDLQEIDRIIFSEEIPYEWVPYEKSANDALNDFLEEDKSYLYVDDVIIEEEDDIAEEVLSEEEIIPEIPTFLDDIIEDHSYVCAPSTDLSGLDIDDLEDVLEDIWWVRDPRVINPYTRWYSWWIATNGSSWGGPFATSWPAGLYSPVRDEWNCDSWFCITIEFRKSDYWLTGWNTQAIDALLTKAAGHLEKPANASLTQRKMTTNNFELWSIIKDLPGMLRGFWIEVQSKPVPILDVESDNEDLVDGDFLEVENLLSIYYKNQGLDYNRRNDLDIYNAIAEETKILQTSGGMPITYVESKSNELGKFRDALKENNRQISLEIDKRVITDDMKDFSNQFAELERFVAAMEDFTKAVAWSIWQMKQIPSRSP